MCEKHVRGLFTYGEDQAQRRYSHVWKMCKGQLMCEGSSHVEGTIHI